MIDGSNRWSDDPATASLRRGKTFITDDFDALETQIRETGLPVELIPVSLRKGEVSFHHCLTFHGSGVNRSERPRQNLIVHLQDELNEYRDAVADDGEPIVYNNDQIVRRRQDGRPDYSDPDVCPIIWEE
jgi:ectoine hydroxylase-related dioxygenase (phytanoyl-CoA dioxygenase family)